MIRTNNFILNSFTCKIHFKGEWKRDSAEQIDWKKNVQNEWNPEVKRPEKMTKKTEENALQHWCRFVYYGMPYRIMMCASAYLLNIQSMNGCRKTEKEKGTKDNVDNVSYDTLISSLLILLFEHALLCSTLVYIKMCRFWANLYLDFFFVALIAAETWSAACLFLT